jgi:L-rhamnose-proton symport protein (RhaT)
MTPQTVQAILLVLCAAIMNASYALPMKLNKKWEWEHTWFAFSILGVAVVPTVIALLTVPRLWSTYSAVSNGTLAAMVLFGASWGVSLVFFWPGPDSFGTGNYFCGLSWNLGCSRRSHSTHRAARESRNDAPRRTDSVRRRDHYCRRYPLRTGGKDSGSCPATGKCNHAKRLLGRFHVGFCLRHSRIYAEPRIGFWRKYSARRAAKRREPGDDVERGMATMPLRWIFAGSNLLLRPDAQETKHRCTSFVRHLVLLADVRQYGSSMVWQHYSLQYLDGQTWGPRHIHWLAIVSRFDRGCQYELWSADRRMETDRDATHSIHDSGGKFSRAGDRSAQLCRASIRPGLAVLLCRSFLCARATKSYWRQRLR